MDGYIYTTMGQRCAGVPACWVAHGYTRRIGGNKPKFGSSIMALGSSSIIFNNVNTSIFYFCEAKKQIMCPSDSMLWWDSNSKSFGVGT